MSGIGIQTSGMSTNVQNSIITTGTGGGAGSSFSGISGGTSGNGIETSGNSSTIQNTIITTGAGGAGTVQALVGRFWCR